MSLGTERTPRACTRCRGCRQTALLGSQQRNRVSPATACTSCSWTLLTDHEDESLTPEISAFQLHLYVFLSSTSGLTQNSAADTSHVFKGRKQAHRSQEPTCPSPSPLKGLSRPPFKTRSCHLRERGAAVLTSLALVQALECKPGYTAIIKRFNSSTLPWP